MYIKIFHKSKAVIDIYIIPFCLLETEFSVSVLCSVIFFMSPFENNRNVHIL